jgi:glucokinase
MEKKTILGIDLGGTNIRVGKVSEYKVVDLYSRRISSNGSEQQVIDEVISSIKERFDDCVAGIGVGVPSLVDVEKGIIYDVQNIPSWKEVHLKTILEREFKVPVYINNDANCFVVGEKYFGNGKDYDNIVGLIVGTGLGAGIYFDNRLYLGANCGAGEFGMLPYKGGCYEDYCSGQFFSKRLNVSGEEIFDKAKTGDKEALRKFQEFGTHLGNVISAIVLAVDPEIIILGGSVSEAYKYFKEAVIISLQNFPYKNSIKNLKITTSSLSQVAILGAAALYFENRGIIAGSPEIEIIKNTSNECYNS